MQPPQPPPLQPTVGPIKMPPSMRRLTGAHAIILQIVLADLAGFLIWLLVGALVGPPIWWITRAIVDLFHVSLLLDLWLLLLIGCIAAAPILRYSVKLETSEAWGCPSAAFLVGGILLIGLWLFKSPWIAIPATAIHAFPLEPITFQPVLKPQGAAIAAVLSLLAHFSVLSQAEKTKDTGQLTLSQAHPDGQIWDLIERAYALYSKGLARFDPPPISRLVTPATIFYYQKQVSPESNEPPNPEQEIYWRNGNLVINRAYIGTEEEQTDILLPQLARQLYGCNTPDRAVEQLFHLATIARHTWPSSWLLALPIYAAKKSQPQWEAMERERVLDRDWFCYACGQAVRLRKWLRLQLKERTDNNLPDNTIPTLAERIDNLDGLLTREKRQVKRLQDMLPPAPPSSTL